MKTLGGFICSIECVERFPMTSLLPYWCSETMKRRPYWRPNVFQINPVGDELFS